MSTLVVICGLSFAGKSTLARMLTAAMGFEEVDVDEVGAALYGLAVGDPALDDRDFDEIYREADRQIQRRLTSGIDVVDASRNFTKMERAQARALAERSNARLVTIFVDTPEAVARERRAANRGTGRRRDITDDQFEEIIRVFEPPLPDEAPLVFRPDDDPATWILTNERALRWDPMGKRVNGPQA